MNIGATLAEARIRAGLNQNQLAARLTMLGLDVTNQAVSKWEKNATQPSAKQLIALCAVLGIIDPLSEFTDGKFGVFAGLSDEGRRRKSARSWRRTHSRS